MHHISELALWVRLFFIRGLSRRTKRKQRPVEHHKDWRIVFFFFWWLKISHWPNCDNLSSSPIHKEKLEVSLSSRFPFEGKGKLPNVVINLSFTPTDTRSNQRRHGRNYRNLRKVLCGNLFPNLVSSTLARAIESRAAANRHSKRPKWL